MNKTFLTLIGASLALAIVFSFGPRETLNAQALQGGSEYLTIRWDGRDNTHIVRPGGQVEFIGPQLRPLTKPDRCDARAFYMNAAMNGLVKEGWEFAGMNPDEIVMRRPLGR